MVEFSSEVRKPSRAAVLIVTVCLLVLAAAGVILYARYQKQSRPPQAEGPVIVPGMLHAGDSNFEYYKTKVRIENPRASLGITFSKTRVAFISGIISNEGDRKLEAVELKITLFDVYNKFSTQAVRTPIRPGTGFYKPMEPLEKRTFSVGIESVEQLWNPKHVEIEITGLKYQ